MLSTAVALAGFYGLIRLLKNVQKDNPTLAYSPVSVRSTAKAPVEVHWARRVQAAIPQISEPKLQEHIIETGEEEGCAVSRQEIEVQREVENGNADYVC